MYYISLRGLIAKEKNGIFKRMFRKAVSGISSRYKSEYWIGREKVNIEESKYTGFRFIIKADEPDPILPSSMHKDNVKSDEIRKIIRETSLPGFVNRKRNTSVMESIQRPANNFTTQTNNPLSKVGIRLIGTGEARVD